MSFFEASMLVCFGFAWPINVIKSYRDRSTKGKNPLFSVVIIVGYIMGIIHKILYSQDVVLILYIINLTMVCLDLGLWFRNRRIETAEMQNSVEHR